MIQGDWTLPNKKIYLFLNQHNRFGIPFNILYSANLNDKIILPELLTKNIMIKALKKIREKEND